ncbi:MAG: S8 family peptidase [Candidatus Hodarchaeales archaeon]|jgi:subtilisin family serine protease
MIDMRYSVNIQKYRRILLVLFLSFLSTYLFLSTNSNYSSSNLIVVKKNITYPNNELSWNLNAINVEGAREITNGSKDVIVAIIDSGIDFSIPELQGSTWANNKEIASNGIDDDDNGYIDDITGWDFVSADNAPYEGDSHWHGSYVANWVKVVAPEISIMDLRILDSTNSFNGTFWPHIVAAINYSINMGAEVINLSMWNYGKSPFIFHDIIKRALAEGVTIVGIVGNSWDAESTKGVLYPGKFPEIIATSSISANNSISYFSRKGPENEISAPGGGLAPIGSITGQGTSFAAPHVSGCIALMKSVNQSLTPVEVRAILTTTATDKGSPGRDDSYGYGLLNVTNAVRGAAGLKTWNNSLNPTTTSTDHSTNLYIFEMICLTLILFKIRKRKLITLEF